jgi:general stress protein CsbA
MSQDMTSYVVNARNANAENAVENANAETKFVKINDEATATISKITKPDSVIQSIYTFMEKVVNKQFIDVIKIAKQYDKGYEESFWFIQRDLVNLVHKGGVKIEDVVILFENDFNNWFEQRDASLHVFRSHKE